jgi:hypothetical protein
LTDKPLAPSRNETNSSRVNGGAVGAIPTAKYHREQAKILASLALSTRDAAKAERFNVAVMEHLAQAEAIEDSDIGPPHGKKPSPG